MGWGRKALQWGWGLKFDIDRPWGTWGRVEEKEVGSRERQWVLQVSIATWQATPKLSGLKWQCIICHSSVGWLGFTGCQFSLGVFLAVVVRWQLGLESSEGSNGLDIQCSFFTYMSGGWVGLAGIARGWLSMLSLYVTSPIWLAWVSS